jgi:hypothetical protein
MSPHRMWAELARISELVHLGFRCVKRWVAHRKVKLSKKTCVRQLALTYCGNASQGTQKPAVSRTANTKGRADAPWQAIFISDKERCKDEFRKTVGGVGCHNPDTARQVILSNVSERPLGRDTVDI